MKIWDCKIGEVTKNKIPTGGDYPMREAVRRAYKELTGEEPIFLFSGWDGKLTDAERSVVENKEPQRASQK